MKKITFLLSFLFTLFFISFSNAQILESFESEADAATSFTSSGKTFNITNGAIENLVVGSGAGVGQSPQFIDNASSCGAQNTLSFSTSDSSEIFMYSLYIYSSTSCTGSPANTSLGVDVKGFNNGIEVYSTTVTNWTNENSNGFTQVNLSALGHGNILVDEIRLDFSSNAVQYVAIDEVI